MALNPIRSIKLPIILGAITVVLSLALMVGWIAVIVRNIALSEQVAEQGTAGTWLLVAGIVSIVVIVGVLVMFSVFLVREAREGRRQVGFIDSVTHELKSPLASLKLCVQTLELRELAPAQRAQIHQMMLDDIDRLNTFIDDILVASRIGQGEAEGVVEVVYLRELVQRVAARIRVRHRIDEAAIAVVVPAELRIVTEATALETVLGNLLDNAVKYSNQPVSVSVRGVVKPRGRLEITVTDRGIGVPEADLRRIFERFYRSSTEDVRTRRGTGLGLYVASSLVKNLGGTLSADSPGRGLGTTLRFELPIGELDRPPNRRPPRAMETGPL